MCSQEVDMREDVYITDIQDGQAKAMLPDATKTQIYMNIYHLLFLSFSF